MVTLMILHLLLFLIAAFLLLFWSGSISFCFDWLELFSGKATGVHLRLYLPSVSISQRRRPKKTFTSRHDTIFILQLELHPLLSFSGAPLWDRKFSCLCPHVQMSPDMAVANMLFKTDARLLFTVCVFIRLWMGRIRPVHKSHLQTSCSGSFFLR